MCAVSWEERLLPKKESLGRSGIRVGRLGLGCVTFGREIDEPTAFAIMDYALEKGITLFDTAEAYGAGQAQEYRRAHLGVDDQREVSSESHSSEKVIGRWLEARGCRKDIVLCTKVTKGFSRWHVEEALHQSLDRLRTDFVDVYMYHSFDANTPAEESAEVLDAAVRSGRVRAAGCSNYEAQQLREALELSRARGLARFEVVQPNYNLVKREIENELLPLCREQEIGVTGYSPLGAGFLTGKYAPDRAAFPRGTRFDVIPGHADVYFSTRNFRIVERLQAFAKKVGVPAHRLAIGWVLQNPTITVVLVGARSTAHIDNALQAQAMEFPAEWLEEMNAWGSG